MSDFDVFTSLLPKKGLELCTRKLYNLKGGDIRHVLDLCRVAISRKIIEIKSDDLAEPKISFADLFEVAFYGAF